MKDNTEQASKLLFAGPLDDPFQDWPNSDLLIEEEDRAYFARHHPELAPVFNWPELRSRFVTFAAKAARARRYSRRAGVTAIATGFLSLAVAATVPMIVEFAKSNTGQQLRAQAVLGGLAAVLAVVSIVLGYTQVLKGTDKAQWLTNRYWAERIRQFHFQLILNHLPEVIAAVKNKRDLQKWLDLRASELDRFEHDYLRGVEDKIHHLNVDEAEDRPWLREEWGHAGPAPAKSTECDRLLDVLERQRLGIQQGFAERKLMEGWHSPETRAQWVLKLSDSFTATLLLATITVGIGSIFVFTNGANPGFRVIAGFVAVISSSSVVAMRALKEGLLFSADAERYRWYLAAVRTLRVRYQLASDPQQKVFILRELEHVAYQEMRRFILAGWQARFVM